MKRLRFLLRNGAIAVAVLSLLSNCAPAREPIVIGVSQCSEDIWRAKLNRELQVAARYYGDVDVLFASADDDSQKQISQIDQFVESGVDLLIISPNQTQAITPAVERAYDAGIPVILFDRKINSEKYTAFMGADNVEIGRALGEYIAKQLGGKGEVAEIFGLAGSSPAADRHSGFMRAMSAYPDIKITGSYYGDWTEESGRAAGEYFKKNHIHFDAVFAQNDRMAVGARETLGNPQDVLFFGIDALSGADGGLQAVLEHKLVASYLYPTRGDLVIDLAMSILNGEAYARENRMESALVDAYNARMFLMQEDEIADQQERFARLNSNLEASLVQLNQQKTMLWMIVGMVMLLMAVIYIVWKSALNTRRLNAELANRNQELQTLSRQMEKNMAGKLEFFTSVSHDFRTPLTLISGPLERVMEGPMNREQKHYLGIIQRNVDILIHLVRNILDFRKIESGNMRLKLSHFDLVPAIREWMDCFQDIAADREFLYFGPETLEIDADRHLVERALFNLLSNAFKFTPSGGRIHVLLSQEGGEAVLQVRDSGIGIPEDKVPFIFNQFYQAGDGTSSGTGVGLALVKSIAELHGGNASVSSRPAEGSLFSIRLPLQHAENKVAAADYVIPEEDKGGRPVESYSGAAGRTEELIEMVAPEDDDRPTVLVVDDNDDIRTYLRGLLGSSFRVLTAVNGADALQKATREQPDLIISDVIMPVMDGVEFCRQLKEQIVTSHIPVILLTAKSLEEQRAEGYESGADAYISKPFSEKVLLSRVNNLIRSRTQLREFYLETGAAMGNSEREKDFFARFREYVQNNLADSELSVEQIAGELGLGRVQLFRKIKALTGYSPLEVVRIMRLKAAERLLKTTDKTVSEIAYQVGFGTPSYFSKCYREMYGKQPTEDRQ